MINSLRKTDDFIQDDKPSPGWGPVRVGSLSGLGPCPGWGPVRVGALPGLGPIWAHRALMGP